MTHPDHCEQLKNLFDFPRSRGIIGIVNRRSNIVLIQKTSMATGKTHVRDLDLTEAQFAELNSPSRRMIQDVVPHLSAEDREYLISGTTPEEWKVLFPPEDE